MLTWVKSCPHPKEELRFSKSLTISLALSWKILILSSSGTDSIAFRKSFRPSIVLGLVLLSNRLITSCIIGALASAIFGCCWWWCWGAKALPLLVIIQDEGEERASNQDFKIKQKMLSCEQNKVTNLQAFQKSSCADLICLSSHNHFSLLGRCISGYFID